jgi:hypothetical protein
MIDRSLLHATRLTKAPGRSGEAWLFRYGREAWVTDVGGGNPERTSMRALGEGRAGFDGPLDVDLLTAEDTLTEGGTLWPAIGSLAADPSFPAPVAEFRAGKVWLAEPVRQWMRDRIPPAIAGGATAGA